MGERRKSRELGERERAEERLRAIVEGTAAKIGEEFFRSLVQHLALALDVKYVFAGELDPTVPDTVRTLAVWTGDGIAENFEYELTHSPCAGVVQQSLCSFPKGVQQLFPRDLLLADMGVESYLGTPLLDESGGSLGLLVVMDDRPMDEDPQGQDLLRIFAARAGVELVRQRAEKALRESESRSRTIIDTTLDAVIAIDEQSIVTGWNHHAEEIFGWSEADAVGRSVADLIIPAELREAHHRGVKRFLATGDGSLSGKRVELEGLHKNGCRLSVELTIAKLRSGGSCEFNAFVRDISERKRAEAERRRLDSEVQYGQKLRSLGVLAGGIAHDFNNLLTGILGSAAIAKHELPADHEIQHHLDEVLSGAKLASHLTAQLLDYAGRGRMQRRPIDLSAEVRGVQALLRTAIHGRARLEFDLASEPPAIEMDAPQIHQVLMNLVINAAESSADEVEIRIATHAVDLIADELSELVPGSPIGSGSCVALDVEDDGCGLDEVLQRRIFDPFFTTKPTGRGLGLAAMLGIVHRHGGGIRLRSSKGAGSQFRILFPALAARVESTPEAGAEDLTGSGLVLAVDDDEYVLPVVRSMLEICGYSVITAQSGPEAIAIYRERHAEIDAVVLDLIMPGMGGEETFATLRGIRSDVRVLFSTGFDSGEIVRRFAEDEFADALRKPYTPEQLARALRGILAKERAVDPRSDFESKFAELQATYRAKLPGLLSDLATAVHAARAENSTEEQWREAWRLAHRLKGTAGSYRFQELAAALEISERVLGMMIERAEAVPGDWERIDAALTRAVAAFGNS